MLQNATTLAIVAVHSADNEPPSVSKMWTFGHSPDLSTCGNSCGNCTVGPKACVLRVSGVHLRRRLNQIESITPNSERLVLFCMDSYDSESGRIFHHFSRSTRFTFLCTAQTSKFQQKTRPNFGDFE